MRLFLVMIAVPLLKDALDGLPSHYLPVYETEEEAKEKYPGADIREISVKDREVSLMSGTVLTTWREKAW